MSRCTGMMRIGSNLSILLGPQTCTSEGVPGAAFPAGGQKTNFR